MTNQKNLIKKITIVLTSLALIAIPIVYHFRDTVPYLQKDEQATSTGSSYDNKDIRLLLGDFINHVMPTFPVLEDESLFMSPNERSGNMNDPYDPIGPTALFYETSEGYRYLSGSLGFSSQISCRQNADAYKTRTKTMSENIDRFMKERGFMKDGANSSPATYFENAKEATHFLEDEKFYDYRLAYKNVDNTMSCVASFSPDCEGGINPGFHQEFSMSCVTQEELKEAETNQVWLLKELELKNTIINVVYETTQGDIPQEATALVDRHDVTKTPLFNHLKNETFFSGGFSSNRGGGYFIAKKIDGKFGIVFEGQDSVSCEAVDKYSIPGSIAGGTCYDYINQKERILSR